MIFSLTEIILSIWLFSSIQIKNCNHAIYAVLYLHFSLNLIYNIMSFFHVNLCYSRWLFWRLHIFAYMWLFNLSFLHRKVLLQLHLISIIILKFSPIKICCYFVIFSWFLVWLDTFYYLITICFSSISVKIFSYLGITLIVLIITLFSSKVCKWLCFSAFNVIYGPPQHYTEDLNV